jgi:hypothetical protein
MAPMDKNIFKNKTVQFVIGLSLGILILVIILSPKKNVSPTGNLAPASPQKTALTPALINLSGDKQAQATQYLASIATKLPLSQHGFMTSTGIKTDIDLYHSDSDPAGTIRFDITGLSYLNSDANPQKNPNVTAFKESYLQGIALLEGVNIDPAKLVFIYSDLDYINQNIHSWKSALKLKP